MPPAEAVEPDLPIVDPHHHLFGQRGDRLRYRREDLARDVDAGHRLIGTVYVEAYESGWRTDGPEALRPVGETEWIAGETAQALPTRFGACRAAAGIVCHADLSLGDAVEPVLHAHAEAARGRLRGVRHRSAHVEGPIAHASPGARRPGLLLGPAFRRGLRRVAGLGLSFDAWIYHPQIAELVDLADAVPEATIVVDHMAGPIGVAQFRAGRAEVMREWAAGLRSLAARPNVVVKVGGLGMPLLGLGFERRAEPAGADALAAAWRPYVEACVEAFGTARCMFESNFPVDKQSCRYVDLWNAFKQVTRTWSVDERRDLFCRTACRIYRLPELLAQADPIVSGEGGN